MIYKNMDKDNEQFKICNNCKRVLNCNDAQKNYFYSCDLWTGDNEQNHQLQSPKIIQNIFNQNLIFAKIMKMKKNDSTKCQGVFNIPDDLRERFDTALMEIIDHLKLKRCNYVRDTIKEQIDAILYYEWRIVNREPKFDWKPYGKNEIRAIRNNTDCIDEFTVRKITDKKTNETYYVVSIETISPEDRSISTFNFNGKYKEQKIAQNVAELYIS